MAQVILHQLLLEVVDAIVVKQLVPQWVHQDDNDGAILGMKGEAR